MSNTADNVVPLTPTLGAEAAPEEEAIKASITVLTSFGSNDPEREHAFQLDYHRIKHVIENKITVMSPGRSDPIGYNVEICNIRAGGISERALEKITKANIVVAILGERNINVIFEIAIRLFYNPVAILFYRDSEDAESLRGQFFQHKPIYLDNFAIHALPPADDNLRKVATEVASQFNWFTPGIPEKLATAIDVTDQYFITLLGQCLQEIENEAINVPRDMSELTERRRPEGFIKGWDVMLPTSVIQIKWKKRAERFKYLPTDMVDTEQPIVRDANDEFKNIFCINQNTQFPSQGPNKVTYQMLMDSIEPFVSDENLDAFNEDQARLSQNLIFGSTMTSAEVPLRMEENHPNVNIRGKVYMPCLVAKHTVGDTDKAHTTYFIISFVERFWPHDHPNNPRQPKS
jgi:hypothetical protein